MYPERSGESNQQNTNKGADAFIYVDSGTAPLAASLYVPRNDTLFKIDRNLIIVYLLGSEEVMTSHGEVLIRKMGMQEMLNTLVIFEYIL